MRRIFVLSLLFSLVLTTYQAEALTSKKSSFFIVEVGITAKKPTDSIPGIGSSLVIYSLRLKYRTSTKYSRRIGFFNSKKSAADILDKIKTRYKSARIISSEKYDKKYISQWQKKVKAARLSQLSITRQAKLYDKAKLHFLRREYKSAIRLLSKLVQSGNEYYQKLALELLGISRERNGQLAHAVAEYRAFLKRFKTDKESVQRVQQRLDALLTVNKKPPSALKKDKTPTEKESYWQYYGALFQFYDKNEIDFTNNSQIISAEQLTTNISFSGRLIDSAYKMRFQFNAVHNYDLDEDETNDNRVTALYMDMASPSRDYTVKAGRQRSSHNGVLGRFDGVDFGYQATSKMKINFVAGYPVEIFSTVDNPTDKSFNSIGVFYTPESKHADYHFYMLEQTADGLTDREEIGAEFRYRHPKHNFTTLFDYSTLYEKINYFVTIMEWKYPDKSSLNVFVNYRQSPFLTTTNALQGQVGVSTLSDLLLMFSEDEIEQLSLDRSAVSKSVTVKYTKPQNEKIKYQGDISVSSLDGTISSGGVEATSNTGSEYSYALSLLGKKWLMKYDNYLFRIRSSQLASSDALIFDASARYRFNRNWRINPRYRVDSREYDDGKKVDKNRLSFRLDYRFKRHLRFEIDLSVEERDTMFPALSPQHETDNIIHLGYIYTF